MQGYYEGLLPETIAKPILSFSPSRTSAIIYGINLPNSSGTTFGGLLSGNIFNFGTGRTMCSFFLGLGFITSSLKSTVQVNKYVQQSIELESLRPMVNIGSLRIYVCTQRKLFSHYYIFKYFCVSRVLAGFVFSVYILSKKEPQQMNVYFSNDIRICKSGSFK